ncbi:outer membrane protein assembly factor BamE [Roseovarius amoyensis]|uniref:outer membrane protein assembly factor BamE n=1 Tax=Roseovarius amoyensis TaxID=2211448 RepID=UPI000DBE7796|nr:outer membrane protein assembly factor BamE [Roseovarius amoyensis]
MIGYRNRVAGLLAALCLIAVAACTAQYRNHGYVPPAEDLQKLVVGVDTRATVDDVIGAPSASGLLSDGDYYYVRSRMREYGPRRPQVVDRKVVAISFNPDDTIRNIETFGLQDGMVVPLTRRVTDSSVLGNGLLRQIFGNFGNIDPSTLFQ